MLLAAQFIAVTRFQTCEHSDSTSFVMANTRSIGREVIGWTSFIIHTPPYPTENSSNLHRSQEPIKPKVRGPDGPRPGDAAAREAGRRRRPVVMDRRRLQPRVPTSAAQRYEIDDPRRWNRVGVRDMKDDRWTARFDTLLSTLLRS